MTGRTGGGGPTTEGESAPEGGRARTDSRARKGADEPSPKQTGGRLRKPADGRAPSREVEIDVLRSLPAGALIAGVDEVGRGSLAGPVSVGIALIDASTGDFPEGLRDSKAMSPAARERMAPLVREWAVDVAVGHAGPDVIDDVGIVAALRHAAKEALNGLSWTPSAVLLDGKHNWWAEDSLFDVDPLLPQIPVRMEVKGDARCAVIAAASVAAKVERDGLMVVLDGRFPGYDWARNKGYASPSHIEGLARLGPSDHHRKSWHLPGVREGHR